MVMLIDAGNSRIKWCWYDGAELGETCYLDYRRQGRNREAAIEQLLIQQQPQEIVLVHVLGDSFEAAVQKACQSANIDCRLVYSSKNFYGVSTAYKRPAQLGADRLVALAGAYSLIPADSACVVIDCGTAVTIDALDEKGLHLGGIIMPGLRLWSDSLINNTELPQTNELLYANVFATNTIGGINSGRLLGLAGAIDHVFAIMRQNMKANHLLPILCGGDAQTLAQWLPETYRLEPDLVLHGLKAIFEK